MNCVTTDKVYAATDFSTVSARGVWHRPNDTGTETSASGVCDVLDKLQRAGVNLVFLETFYHGMAAFRSNYVPYNSGLAAFSYGEYQDYLSCFVAEAEKRGIEVHAWVEDFYVGVNENYFTRTFPDWIMLTDKGGVRQNEGKDYGGYIFLDPTNKDVTDYLTKFYDELLTKHPKVAGLNLDYIRYPVTDRNTDAGHTKSAISAFCSQQGISGQFDSASFANYVSENGLYSAWVDFRANAVTEFVAGVFDMVKTSHRDKLLSTAIFPETQESYDKKKQDFRKWIDCGYLDIVTPMAYYDDNSTLKSELAKMLASCDSCYCYVGLSSTYHGLTGSKVLSQIDVCSQSGADGFVFFGSKSVLEGKNGQDYVTLLNGKFGAVSADLPHSAKISFYDKFVAPLADYLVSHGEAANDVATLTEQLSPLKNCDQGNAKSLSEGVKALKMIVKYNLSQLVSQTNFSYAEQTLSQALRLSSVLQKRLEVKGDVSPSVPTDDPDNTPDGNGSTQKPSTSGGGSSSKVGTTVAIVTSSAALALSVLSLIVAAKRGKK